MNSKQRGKRIKLTIKLIGKNRIKQFSKCRASKREELPDLTPNICFFTLKYYPTINSKHVFTKWLLHVRHVGNMNIYEEYKDEYKYESLDIHLCLKKYSGGDKFIK